MLVLSRKQNESVVINGPCVIHVVALSDGSVRLGFEADRATVIARSELIVETGARAPLWDVWQRLTQAFRSSPIESV